MHTCFLKVLFMYLFSLFEREISYHWLTLKMSTIARAGQAEAGSQQLHLSIPHKWQGSEYLSRHLLPPEVCMSWKLESGAEQELEARHSDMQCGHPQEASQLLHPEPASKPTFPCAL